MKPKKKTKKPREKKNGAALAKPKKLPPPSNIEVIVDLMTYSNYGALAQMFVIDALTKYASDVIASNNPDDAGRIAAGSQVWVGLALEIKDKLEAQYGYAQEEKP